MDEKLALRCETKHVSGTLKQKEDELYPPLP